MPEHLYLINADEPSSFKCRKVEVVRRNVRLGKQVGIIVTIEPAIESLRAGSLATALLLPRHVGISLNDMRGGRPIHVYVCRILDKANEAADELTKQDVSIALWGLVGASPTLDAADIFA